MAAVPELTGVLAFERDLDDEVLGTWVYPKIEAAFKDLLAEKCRVLLNDHANVSFCYGHSQKLWYYIQCTNVQDTGVKRSVSEIFIIVTAKNFNPELYENLAKVLTKHYIKGTSATLSSYLSFYTKGFCVKDDSTKLSSSDFDNKKAYLNTCVKEIIQLFGMETILIYNALMLKKRIVVYSPKLDTLQHVCRTLPAFVFHRLNWNIVYPLLSLAEEELAELKTQRTYVAGFTDIAIENNSNMYDLFLNVADGEVVINPQAKEHFQMGKMHKEMAKYMMQAAEDEDVIDEDIIRELSRRTTDIITNLKSLDTDNPTDPKITMDLLQSRNLTSAMQTFLYNLASAEGLIRL